MGVEIVAVHMFILFLRMMSLFAQPAIASGCGMKHLSREAAYGKLKSLVEGAAIVQSELEGKSRGAKAPQ